MGATSRMVSGHPMDEVGFGGKPLAYLDLEFTGLEPKIHDITEIAILKPAWAWEEDKRPTVEPFPGWLAWNVKVWPEHLETASAEALRINGFHEPTWRREAIGLLEAMGQVYRMLAGSIVVGHNSFLDLAFLREAFQRCDDVPFLDVKYRIDSATLIWEHLVPLGLTRGSLADACTVCGISNAGEHRALADVIRCKLVVDALVFRYADPLEQSRRVERIATLEASRGSTRSE